MGLPGRSQAKMRHFRAGIRSAALPSVLGLLLGCSNSANGFAPAESKPDASASDAEAEPDVGPGIIGNGEAKPPCVGLKCNQVPCDRGETTVSGTVFDPAGKTPLYNVIVYVPNTPVEPFTDGATCDQCGAAVSGSPVVTALTDPKGNFVLKNVPVGDDIPLVMQVGRWRRQVTIPKVSRCRNNPLTDREMTRLPRTRDEGDIPKMALATGGCDALECLLRKIGIDDSEFSDPAGNGRVHLYRGQGGGSFRTGSFSRDDAYDFWVDEDKLKGYDIVLNSCECSPLPRQSKGGVQAYQPMKGYLNAGGKLFGTHYHYNWFSDGPQEFRSVADWLPGSGLSGDPYYINTTFPKGQAFADWFKFVVPSSVPGQVGLTYADTDVGTVTSQATNWIYSGRLPNSYSSKYLSFNTPTTAPDDEKCGRAVFSDLHVASGFSQTPFPSGCDLQAMTEQEKALEFLFFDLSSCVQKDSEPPQPPVPR